MWPPCSTSWRWCTGEATAGHSWRGSQGGNRSCVGGPWWCQLGVVSQEWGWGRGERDLGWPPRDPGREESRSLGNRTQQSRFDIWGSRRVGSDLGVEDPVLDLGGVGKSQRDPEWYHPSLVQPSPWACYLNLADSPPPLGRPTGTRTSTKKPQTSCTMRCRSGSRRWAPSTPR